MKNENFRNFNVCGKATASQKELYRKKADEAGLSLSEWTVTILDLYLQQERAKEKERIERKSKTNTQVFLNTNENVVYYSRGGISNKSKLETKKITPNSNETNIALQKEIQQLKSLSSSFNQLGGLALIGAILLRR
jgi:hypothetical protein